ncbi:hypothetical protein [Halovivax cerinus]|uniref:Uncharacterized protein n=1 Tax=Halovivax cerinus TaxID=1487865 RepID=A0ABD5NTS0_9EURY|nr:hypothetical protein [Halovivax cerinus]
MRASIDTESADRITVTVVDNADDRHRITVERGGDVVNHQCDRDGPTSAEPSAEDAVRADRSIRFAKYYCYRTRSVDTLDPYGTDRLTYPERLVATTLWIASMEPPTVTEHFPSLYRLYGPADDIDEDTVPPPDVDDEWIGIDQPVFLDVEPDRLRTLLDTTIELEALGALRHLLDRYPDRRGDTLAARLTAILGTRQTPRPSDESAPDRYDPFVTTAPLDIRRPDDTSKTVQTDDGEAETAPGLLAARIQFDRDVRPVTSPAALQRRLFDHLRCQLRDCYVGMGLAPPRDVRVRGPGIAWFARSYDREPTTQRYHDPDAIVDWTALAPIPRF